MPFSGSWLKKARRTKSIIKKTKQYLVLSKSKQSKHTEWRHGNSLGSWKLFLHEGQSIGDKVFISSNAAAAVISRGQMEPTAEHYYLIDILMISFE